MKRIVFELNLFASEGQRVPSERVLTKALELLYTADVEWLRANPTAPGIYESGVWYEREPIPREIWKTVPYCIRDARNGKGSDCEDLACWLAAQKLVREGIDARPAFTYRKIGNLSIYHIVTKLPDGTILDPSKRLGM